MYVIALSAQYLTKKTAFGFYIFHVNNLLLNKLFIFSNATIDVI